MVIRDVFALPKAHLHVHLEGSMRPVTVAALASIPGYRPDIQGYDNFTTFAATYVAVCSVLGSSTTCVVWSSRWSPTLPTPGRSGSNRPLTSPAHRPPRP